MKELGRDNELVLYEGLRPILAKKNRYYEDPLFKKRLFPPPKHASPALARRTPAAPSAGSAPAAAAGSDGLTIETPQAKTPTAAVQDTEQIGARTTPGVDVEPREIAPPQTTDGERLTPGRTGQGR